MAYNVERLLWLFSDGDSELVKKLMNQLESTHRIEIPSHVLSKVHFKSVEFIVSLLFILYCLITIIV